MVSCTEFMPLYSELFKYLENKGGKQEVVKYWNYISDEFVEKSLGEEIRNHGLKGCWNYWNKSLNEEACEFSMTYDEEKNYFEIDMKGCPSKGMINKLGFMKPYANYCEHCDVLYSRVAKKYGIEIVGNYENVDKACCKFVARQVDGNNK